MQEKATKTTKKRPHPKANTTSTRRAKTQTIDRISSNTSYDSAAVISPHLNPSIKNSPDLSTTPENSKPALKEVKLTGSAKRERKR
jgi:hypothetical protein